MKRDRASDKGRADAPRRAYKVFVSSTYLDNRERRKVVQDAITMAGMVWHGDLHCQHKTDKGGMPAICPGGGCAGGHHRLALRLGA